MTWQLSALIAFILAFIGAIFAIVRLRKQDADDGAAQQRKADKQAADAITREAKEKADAIAKLNRDAKRERAARWLRD